MRIIVINLDEDTERRTRIESRLLDLGLSWERLPAVDGRRLAPRHESLIDRATWRCGDCGSRPGRSAAGSAIVMPSKWWRAGPN